MAKNLIIVESPNKIEKIQSFFGDKKKVNDYKVIASVGHIRDLKKYGTYKRLGIDIEQMQPIYINIKEKKEVISKINQEAKKAEKIYIATDPDREGEAIGWHITQVIDDKSVEIKRIFFNEITKEAVLNSLENVVDLDMNLVNSQETRRMLDRIIGFRLSFLTQKKLSAPSAGRVKSSTLKLIIDRENEIKAFKPEFWWTIEAIAGKNKILYNSDRNFKIIQYSDYQSAEITYKIVGEKFELIDQKERTITIPAPLPLEMATYLIGMFNNFGVSNVQATFTAQSLYEKGLITYPRTDSTRISSASFINDAQSKIIAKYGNDYYSGVKIAKTKKQTNLQDAHEAIRPTNINMELADIDGLNSLEKKAYLFIWTMTMKSLMSNGTNKNINLLYDNNEQYFVHKISKREFLGFRKIDEEYISKEADASSDEIPDPYTTELSEKNDDKISDKLSIKKEKIAVIEHKTTPPPRYNQASIIKKLKSEGIGRPSTYSSTTSGLINYNYLKKENNYLMPTDLAFKVNDLLLESFNDIVHEKYTAGMETVLDEISQGKKNGRDYLKDFWQVFEKRVEDVDAAIEKPVPELVNEICPLCGDGDLIYKSSRYGKFIGCSNFPKCKYIRKISQPNAEKSESESNLIEEKCPISDHKLVIRSSRFDKNKHFIGCSNFPKCKFIMDKKEAKILLEKYGFNE